MKKMKVDASKLKDVRNSKRVQQLAGGASEFKKFISRGNVVDMAIGVIIGGAFGKIVTSLVQDMLMPLIGVLLGGLDFADLSVKVGGASIAYGSFLQSVVDFLIISFSIFMVVKLLEKFKRANKESAGETVTDEAAKSDEAILLEEIRDLLRDKQANK